MTPATVLLRQIHPTFMKEGEPSSQAFRPTPKDHDLLSFEDGDRISACDAWQRYTGNGGTSDGVLGVSADECRREGLDVEADGVGVPEHVSVHFGGKTTGQRKQIAKRLRDRAVLRGWLFRPVGGG
jgi:phage baseplate assembly protein gpV